MSESCHTYEWVMSHLWVSHVTPMSESCHTSEWHTPEQQSSSYCQSWRCVPRVPNYPVLCKLLCVAVCCSELQWVVVCCSVLQSVAVCCSVFIVTLCATCTKLSSFVYTPVCCSVLQCVAVCCSVLQWVAVSCSVLQCAAVCCSVLQCIHRNVVCHVYQVIQFCVYSCVLQCVAMCCSVLQCVAVCCNVLQRVAVCCSVLQCVAACWAGRSWSQAHPVAFGVSFLKYQNSIVYLVRLVLFLPHCVEKRPIRLRMQNKIE